MCVEHWIGMCRKHTLKQTHINCRIPSRMDRSTQHFMTFTLGCRHRKCFVDDMRAWSIFIIFLSSSLPFHIISLSANRSPFASLLLCVCVVWHGSDIYLPFYATRKSIVCFGLGTLICYIVNTYLFVTFSHFLICSLWCVVCVHVRRRSIITMRMCLCRFKSNGIQFDVTNKMKNINST